MSTRTLRRRRGAVIAGAAVLALSTLAVAAPALGRYLIIELVIESPPPPRWRLAAAPGRRERGGGR
jgi:hypothetical protein